MSIKKDVKTKIIGAFAQSSNDTGSSEVQIAVLSERIKNLTEHFKANPKDNHSRRGLLILVSRRKRLLDYLKRVETERYLAVVSKLGLRK